MYIHVLYIYTYIDAWIGLAHRPQPPDLGGAGIMNWNII